MNTQERTPVFTPKLVFGLTVILLGLILMADSLHWYDAWHLLTWWPLVLAAFGVAHLVRDGILSLGGHVWLGFSVAAFIQQFGPDSLLERWWPVFVIWGGIVVTLRAIYPQAKRVRPGKAAPPPPTPSPTPADSCDPETESKQVQP